MGTTPVSISTFRESATVGDTLTYEITDLDVRAINSFTSPTAGSLSSSRLKHPGSHRPRRPSYDSEADERRSATNQAGQRRSFRSAKIVHPSTRLYSPVQCQLTQSDSQHQMITSPAIASTCNRSSRGLDELCHCSLRQLLLGASEKKFRQQQVEIEVDALQLQQEITAVTTARAPPCFLRLTPAKDGRVSAHRNTTVEPSVDRTASSTESRAASPECERSAWPIRLRREPRGYPGLVRSKNVAGVPDRRAPAGFSRPEGLF